jgi:hypothetical protein
MKIKLLTLTTVLAIAAITVLLNASEKVALSPVQIVNYSETPVFATAVVLPRDKVYASSGVAPTKALKAIDSRGREIPLVFGMHGGAEVLFAYLSLQPAERIDLDFQEADNWASDPFIAEFSSDTGRGIISNGLLRFEYEGDRWKLYFDGPLADTIAPLSRRELVRHATMDLWLDTRNRGRLLDYTPTSLRQLGLIHSSDARLVDGEAKVNPDGSVSLKLIRAFDGAAEGVTWTQTYTLLPGIPQVLIDIAFTVENENEYYLAYVNQGSGLDAQYGYLLRQGPLYKYDDPRNPSGSLASGASSPLVRVAWRNERCWLGLASAGGAGLAVSTLEETRSLDRGATVWFVSSQNFRATLLEDERKHFPFDLSKEQPFNNGLTLLASAGNIDMWQQTRALFHATTRGQQLDLIKPYAVFIAGNAVQSGFLSQGITSASLLVPTADQAGLQAAVRMDLSERRILSVASTESKLTEPLTIHFKELPEGRSFSLPVSQGSELTVDLTELIPAGLHNSARNKGLLFEATPARFMESVRIEKAPPLAPELVSPRNQQSVTDIAVFFRWKRVGSHIDYELQWSVDKDFSNPDVRRVRMETPLIYYMPKDEELPEPGKWYWRARALDGEIAGEWSEVFSMKVNNDHSKKPLGLSLSPETPLFTIEGTRIKRSDVANFREILPPELRAHAAYTFTPMDNDDGLQPVEQLVEFFAPLASSEMRFFTRAKHPGPIAKYYGSLAEIEALFQENPNAMGICSGESMSALYRGGQETLYSKRLIQLCAKYGKLYYMADGTYPRDDKWVEMYSRVGDFLEEYKDYIAFAQKNNILQRQFLSQSATLGLYLSGATVAHGAWEDGGWYWQQVGFRELGNLQGRRGGDVRAMPRIFWALNFVMGISRGTTIFSLEGQTGTAPPQDGLRDIDMPLASNPSAYWTRDGHLLPTFGQFIQPLLQAIVEHELIPSREDLLRQTRIAVYNDGLAQMRDDQDPFYRQYHALYAGTYGFRPMGSHPGELYEFFPNTGRFHYIPFLPQGRVELGFDIELMPLSDLLDVDTVRSVFNSRYPSWYEGDALVGLVGDTLTVLNSNENFDERQHYYLPLVDRGFLKAIGGTIEVHSYLVGKFKDSNQSLWMQINSEYPEREMQLRFTTEKKPALKITPSEALVSQEWVDGTLELRLSHAHGVIEMELQP